MPGMRSALLLSYLCALLGTCVGFKGFDKLVDKLDEHVNFRPMWRKHRRWFDTQLDRWACDKEDFDRVRRALAASETAHRKCVQESSKADRYTERLVGRLEEVEADLHTLQSSLAEEKQKNKVLEEALQQAWAEQWEQRQTSPEAPRWTWWEGSLLTLLAVIGSSCFIQSWRAEEIRTASSLITEMLLFGERAAQCGDEEPSEELCLECEEVASQTGAGTDDALRVRELARVKATGRIGKIAKTNGHAFKLAGKWYAPDELEGVETAECAFHVNSTVRVMATGVIGKIARSNGHAFKLARKWYTADELEGVDSTLCVNRSARVKATGVSGKITKTNGHAFKFARKWYLADELERCEEPEDVLTISLLKKALLSSESDSESDLDDAATSVPLSELGTLSSRPSGQDEEFNFNVHEDSTTAVSSGGERGSDRAEVAPNLEQLSVRGLARVRATGLHGRITKTNGHAFKLAGKWYTDDELEGVESVEAAFHVNSLARVTATGVFGKIARSNGHAFKLARKWYTAEELEAVDPALDVNRSAMVKATGLSGKITKTNGHAFKLAGRWYLADELERREDLLPLSLPEDSSTSMIVSETAADASQPLALADQERPTSHVECAAAATAPTSGEEVITDERQAVLDPDSDDDSDSESSDDESDDEWLVVADDEVPEQH